MLKQVSDSSSVLWHVFVNNNNNSHTVAYPLDVVRRRMQMQGVGGRQVEYTSLVDGFRTVYVKYGMKGFYKGLIPNYLKVVPVVSINFVVYEYMKKLLGLTTSSKEV